MRDLADLMNDALTERSASLGDLPTASVADRVRRRVRLRRARRHTLEAGGVTAAVALLGSATWFGLDAARHTPSPAVSPTVSTPTPSTSPSSPAPTPSATAAPVVLDEVPGLPPTQAMPPGLLDRTGPGWVLAVYEPEPVAPEGEDLPVVEHTAVLVSPAGDRYRVVDLPLDTEVHLLHWEAGSTTAVVSRSRMDDDSDGDARAVLDLTTGTMTAEDVGIAGSDDGELSYQGMTADGAELWASSIGEGPAADLYRRTADGAVDAVGTIRLTGTLLDPTGHWMVTGIEGVPDEFQIVDVVHGGDTAFGFGVPGKSCEVVGWLEPGALLVECSDPQQDSDPVPHLSSTLFRVDFAGGVPRATELKRFADDEPSPVPWSGAPLGDGRAAFSTAGRGDDRCQAGVDVWDGHAVVPLEGGGDAAFVNVAVGSVVYVEAAPSCGPASQAHLTVHDLASGTSMVLAPEVGPTADVAKWLLGLRTWAVAGAHTPVTW
ncbi:hypothetical protein [Cellulomonas sp. URHB0016]